MKRYFYSLFILLSIFLFLILSGCKKDETPTAPQNHLPKIESLTANPTTVLISTEITLTCIATDEDGDNLTITWSSKRGTFSNGVAVKWVSPSTAGTDTINVTVNDGKQIIQGKLEIIVGTISASPTLLTPSNNATEVAQTPTLTWNAVSNAVSYTLQVSTSSSFTTFVYNQNNLTNTSQLISGLNSNATYYWRVNSTNVYGTSGWSNVFSFKTVAPPQAPTLLTPTNNATEVALTPTLTWNALSNAVSYTLQISTSGSFTSFVFNQNGLTNTSQQISGLNIATSYYWRVNATNSYGTSSWSNFWTFTTISAWNLQAEATGSSLVRLTWIDFAVNGLGFQIERTDPSTNNYKVLAITGPNVTEYIDNSVTDSSSYKYRVAYFTQTTQSGYSNEVSISTYFTDVLPPTNLSAVILPGPVIRLTWTDNSKNLSKGTVVERKVGTNDQYIEIGNTASDVFEFIDQTIHSGTTYFYRIRQKLENKVYTPYSSIFRVDIP